MACGGATVVWQAGNQSVGCLLEGTKTMVWPRPRARDSQCKVILKVVILGASCIPPQLALAGDANPQLTTSSVAAVYVATDGNDASDGTFNHPFASLERAAMAAQKSSTKTVMVEGGHYTLTAPVLLDTASAGLTLIAYPGQHPVFDGDGVSAEPLLLIRGSHKVTIVGLGFINTAPNGHALELENSSGMTSARWELPSSYGDLATT